MTSPLHHAKIMIEITPAPVAEILAKRGKLMNVKKTERIYTPITSFKHLVELCADRGDKPVFKYPVGKTYETLSYTDFAHEIYAIAAGLDKLGLAGKRIAVIGETSHQWVASYFATVTSGGVIVPMDNAGCAEGIAGVLRDPQLQEQLIENTKQQDYTNAAEIQKLYQLIEG